MKRCLSLLAALSLMLGAAPAFAAVFQAAEDDDELFTVTIPVQDDLYVAGGLVHINEKIDGDLIIAGGEVEVKGDVTGDLIGAGGSVIINGNVDDDVRAAGGDIKINGTVGDDLIIAGGNIRVGSDAVIEGDAIIFGGMIIMDGVVKGNLRSFGGNVVLSGTVNGDVDLRTDMVQLVGSIRGNAVIVGQEANVGDQASIEGNLEYWVPYDENPYEGIVGGETVFNGDLRGFDKSDVVNTTFFGAMKVAMLAFLGYTLLSATLFILLMVLTTNMYFTKAAKKVRKAPWKCLLWGLLYFILTPIIAVLFVATIIGIPIAFFIFALYGFAIFFAKPLTAMIAAKWFAVKAKKKQGKVSFFFMSILAYIILKLLGLIPIVGWIVVFVAVLFAFGALLETKMEIWKKVR